MRIAVERRGRPPMPDRKRDARGRSRGESPAKIVATARAQRIKAGADADDALNALHGTTLGILHRRWQLRPTEPGGVSADQYDAAQAYIATVFHHAEIMGLPMPWPGGVASRPNRSHRSSLTASCRHMLHLTVRGFLPFSAMVSAA